MKDLTLVECESILGGDLLSYDLFYAIGRGCKAISSFFKPDHSMGIPFCA
jgi:hypothetical protein